MLTKGILEEYKRKQNYIYLYDITHIQAREDRGRLSCRGELYDAFTT